MHTPDSRQKQIHLRSVRHSFPLEVEKECIDDLPINNSSSVVDRNSSLGVNNNGSSVVDRNSSSVVASNSSSVVDRNNSLVVDNSS